VVVRKLCIEEAMVDRGLWIVGWVEKATLNTILNTLKFRLFTGYFIRALENKKKLTNLIMFVILILERSAPSVSILNNLINK
jgi:hypothetical protein